MGRKGFIVVLWIIIAVSLIVLLSAWHVRVNVLGGDEITVPYGSRYDDAGAVATVEGPGVPKGRRIHVRSKGDVDTDEVGSYTVKYDASFWFYHDEAERTVHVEDEAAPMLILEDRPETVVLGDEWTDGYRADDDHDGDLTGAVLVFGAVDTETPGEYTLTYSVTDAAGNTSTAQRTVTVTDHVEPVTGSKIVFLTFDDGPSENTARLLDILAAHNAKVTFFVTGMYPDYEPMIGREFEEGHTVAVHTLTHNYSKVYASDEAYWADFEAMNDIVEANTGRRANIFRFPGGASNTVSRSNPGIMTRLAQEAAERGLEYFDWNVDSNDAGGATTADEVYRNITGSVEALDRQGYDVMVVLCHDTHNYTVDAMDRVLTWFEENGYTLMALQKGITVCHHGIAN